MWWLSVSYKTIKDKQISCSNSIISNSYETVNFQRQVQYSNNRRFPVGLPDLASCDCTPHCVPSRLFNRQVVYWQPAAVRLFRSTFDDGRFQSTVWIFCRFTIIRHFQSAISGWIPRLVFLRHWHSTASGDPSVDILTSDCLQLSVHFVARSMTVGFNRQFESSALSQ